MRSLFQVHTVAMHVRDHLVLQLVSEVVHLEEVGLLAFGKQNQRQKQC